VGSGAAVAVAQAEMAVAGKELCCSVLQCVAVSCSVLRCVVQAEVRVDEVEVQCKMAVDGKEVCCGVLQCVAGRQGRGAAHSGCCW